jgi:N-acetylglucosamine-6-phosphate deacetylase
MVAAVRNAADLLEVPLEMALRMASTNPASLLGLSDRFGAIAPGYVASLVLLDDERNVKTTWISGREAA